MNISLSNKRIINDCLAHMSALDADGAQSLNGVGYNKWDSHNWSHITEQNEDRGCYYACNVLQKYRKQLRAGGLDLPTVNDLGWKPDGQAPRREVVNAPVLYATKGDRVGIWLGKGEWPADWVARTKSIEGRWYMKEWSGESHVSTYPLSSVAAINKEFGLDIQVPAGATTTKPEPTKPVIHHFGDSIGATFEGFSPDFNRKAKAIAGSSYRPKFKGLEHVRLFPLSSWDQVEDAFPDSEMPEDPGGSVDRTEKAVVLSSATESDFDHEYIDGRIYDYQRAGVEFFDIADSALMADSPGLGKTLQSISAVLSIKPDDRPCLIVCPSIVKQNWANEIDMWNPHEETVHIVDGVAPKTLEKAKAELSDLLNETTPDGSIINRQRNKISKIQSQMDDMLGSIRSASVVIINWEILFAWHEELLEIGFVSVIADEVHRAKTIGKMVTDRNTKEKSVKSGKTGYAFLQLTREIDRVIGLTGTPIMNRPIELFPLMKFINPDAFPNWVNFGKRYCNGHRNRFGWDMSGSSNLDELHKLMKPHMIRRTKEEVLTDLPELQNVFLPVELERKYLTMYNAAVSEAQRQIAEGQTHGAAKLALIEKAKQIAVEGKLKEARAWISEFLESGEKLIVFTTHTAPVEALSEAFPDVSASLTGAQSRKAKDAAVHAFQSDPDVRLCIANIAAASEGITLTAASNTLFLEFPWSPKNVEQASSRAHRNGQKNAVTSWFLYAPNTIEDFIVQLLNGKAGVIDQVIDGKGEDSESFADSIVKRFMES